MLKVSLVILFVMSMATLTVAASYLPSPPQIGSGSSAAVY
jgi:hypothetical protein